MYNISMNKDATRALEAGIYAWIDDNKDLVKLAQELSNLTLNQGICDTNLHNPFQIVPTDEFSHNGNLKHELFLNIDHPAWGYFKIIINSPSNYIMIPPRLTLHNETIFLNKTEVENFINYLSGTLDDLYSLQSCLECKKWEDAKDILNRMLAQYHNDVDDDLIHIRKYIDTFPGTILISATNSNEKQKLDKTIRYDLALMHPENWHVLDYSGINTIQNAEEELRCKILDFFITESQSAAFLYVAQKLVIESGYSLIVHTDSKEPEPDLTNEVLIDKKSNLTLVRPVIHCTELELLF